MKTKNRIWLCPFLVLGLTIIHINSCKKADESHIVATDNDGNTYKSVTIGTQVWMAENLKTTKYKDGTAIQRFDIDKYYGSNPSYCWYNGDSINNNIYGALYSWGAVETGELCPTGWHIPSDVEWLELINYLGRDSLAGGKLKETGTIHWSIPNTDTDNSSGFTALPAGYHTGCYTIIWYMGTKVMFREERGVFMNIGVIGVWWSSTNTVTENVTVRGFITLSSTGELTNGKTNSPSLYSVRCVKDIN